MDFFKSIPGVEVAQVARPTPSKRRKYSIHLTEREAAETRLARPDNFCICCHNLRWRHLGDHSPTKIGDLKKSSYEGCHTCGLLLDWVDRLMRAHDERGDKVLGKGLRGKVKGVDLRFRETLELDISIEGFPRGLRWELHTLLGTPALWTTIQPLPTVPGNTQSDSSALWILQKLHQCSKFHGYCAPEKELSRLPTRILDLGAPEWPKDSSLVQQYLTTDLKLYQPEADPSFDKYICLSHCWRKTDSMPKTTSCNIQEHLGRISYSSLPTTFQDAVVFTRKLCIRFLWIDSICIIQDDKDDWMREASKVCQVFQASYLTLCATTAPDCSHGLFVNSSRDELRDSRSMKIETTPWEVHARHPLDHSCIPASWQVIGKYPLLNRGWVYQERLLARRVLHFGPQELIWECASETTCECSLIDPFTPKQIHTQALQIKSAFKKMTRWHEVVEEYSKLALTFESDRLPALRGLITQFQSWETFRNVAGLWEGYLLFDLLWEAAGPERTRPDKRVIPTWLWATVTGNSGHVSYPDVNIISSIHF
ncbi:HET-domain-containing protein [Hyaloscypha variabilis F]|uniref:HET-domain-containing protein n=1 Tax=Hyaloscypha variabilis (strain UAMH 11265 / GT02V1 / F) TaxID=1149755 RepID=A0A2J6RWR2_HYAVF|nr:HET-domain-containing protein [Hyaloscypha variabilis F]